MCSSGNPLLYLYPLPTSPHIGATPVTINYGYRYFGHVENRWLSTVGRGEKVVIGLITLLGFPIVLAKFWGLRNRAPFELGKRTCAVGHQLDWNMRTSCGIARAADAALLLRYVRF